MTALLPQGFSLLPEYLDQNAQIRLAERIWALIEEAPLFTPRMPRTGRPFSVKMTNLGPLGWVSDQGRGYRYEALHPEIGKPWPAIPGELLALWRDVTGAAPPPECCLVNLYRDGRAKMGLHQDNDEQAFDVPVVSVSLGDKARFRVGGPKRGGATRSMILSSGDVVLLGGEARLAFHGIDRIYPATSTLVPGGGRINLTLRRVTPRQ